jgi:hypothetical protein
METVDESNDRREMNPTAALPKSDLIIYDPSPKLKTVRMMGQ